MSTFTKYFKRAPKPSEVVSAVQSDFTNREKEEVVKQLSEKEESVKNTGHRVSEKNLKLVNMSYDMELHQLWDIYHRNIQGISKQSISYFKKVC